MPVFFIDVETRGVVDLKVAGAYRYAADAMTEALCLAYAVDDAEPAIWEPGQPVPQEFITAATDPAWTVVAHNDQFERVISQHILEPRHGFPAIPLEQWQCSMATALSLALPGKLENVAAALNLPHQKDAAGAALMKQMARPRRPRKGEDPNGIYWHDSPELRRRLAEYCCQDVRVERALYQTLPPLISKEQKVRHLDAAINARGFHVDGELIDAAHQVVTAANAERQAEFRSITGLDSTNQTAKLITWLAELDCIATDVQKGTLKHCLRRKGLAPGVRRAIELRLQLAHASAAKVEALRAWRGEDGRVRGTLSYHGAATGRWVGRGPQPQNFRRDGQDIESKITAVMNGGAGLESPVEAVGDIGRAMICAAPGHRLIVGDFSGIESRVLAWISGQQSKVDAWTRFDETGDPNDDPYVLIGRSLGHPEDKARDFGKIADLAFGYQGGVGAWKNFSPEDDASDETTIKRYRDAWRNQHPQTVRFWYALDRAAINAVRSPGTDHRVDRLTFRYDAPFLRALLPSGRSISYPFPRIEPGKFGHDRVIFLDSAGGKFADCGFGNGAYGGLWAENVTSGIARDLLAGALMRLEAAGYEVVLHVHDEIVVEAPDGFGGVEEFRQIITALPAWAEGLPVAAKVRNGQRFAKSESSPEDVSPEPAMSPRPDEPPVDEFDDRADDLFQNEPSPTQDSATESAPEANPAGPMLGYPEEQNNAPAGISEVRAQPGNGQNGHDASPSPRHSSDGHVHGDSGPKQGASFAQWIYVHPDQPNWLRVDKHMLPDGERKFYQHHWNGTQWIPGVKGTYAERKIPYRLPELKAALRANPDVEVQLCEGEKDADTMARLGFVATTNPGGALSWTPELTAWFHILGVRRVAIHEDNDEKGRQRTARLTAELSSFVKLRVVRYPDVPNGEDVTWWLEHGHNKDELLARIEAAAGAMGPLIQSSAEFITGFTPPDYVVVGLLQRRFLYSNTGQTGAGKTAIGLRLAACVAQGALFAGRRTRKSRVLYAAAENPDDVRMRWIALSEQMGFDIKTIEVYFTSTRFKISQMKTVLRDEAEKYGGEFGLVIIDTSPAFFEGDDENSRSQMGAHACLLRDLINVIPGGPAVVANCHPVKNATPDNLLPAGGGTFLNEVDGNLTSAKNDSITELHWQGKFRGPEFAPMSFLIKTVTHRDVKDSEGNLLPTVICEPLGYQAKEEMVAAGRREEDQVLSLIKESPAGSYADVATHMQWFLFSGEPNKMKVKRCFAVLKKEKLIKETRRGRHVLTPEGEKALELQE